MKTRSSFPNDNAALKLLYLAIRNAGMRWRRGIEWSAAMGQFAIQFGARGFRDQHDEEECQNSSTPSGHDRHRRNTDYRLVRSFAVQPRPFGAPLRSFRA